MAPSTVDAPWVSLLRRRGLVAALTVATGFLLVKAFIAGCTKAYAIDEFYYAHMTWEATRSASALWTTITNGTRFVTTFALTPATLLAGDDPANMILVRLSMLPLFFASLAMMASIAARRVTKDRRAITALLTVFFALALHPFAWRGMEIRPDVIAFFLFLCCWWLLEFKPGSRWPRIGAGVCLFLSCFASVKAFIYGAAFFPFFLLDQWALLRRRRQVLEHAWLFAMGFVGAAAVLTLTIVGTDSVGEFWNGFYEVPKTHQKYYPRIPQRRFWTAFWHTARPVLLATAVGLLVALWRTVQRFRRDRGIDRHALVVTLAVTTTLSYTLQKAAYPYSMIPACGVFAILAALGVNRLVELYPTPWLTMAFTRGAVIVGFLAYLTATWMDAAVGLSVRHSNARQIELQHQIGKLTSVEDRAYDMSSTFFTRHGAHHLPIVDNSRRRRYGTKFLSAEVSRDLVANEAVLFVLDGRFAGTWRNTELGEFVTKNYQPYNNDLHLWGRRWSAFSPFVDEFWAIKSGEYFVYPPAAAQDIQVDGRPLDGPRIALEKGAHQIEFIMRQRYRSDVYVIWLPRSGEMFDPTAPHPPFYLGRYILP